MSQFWEKVASRTNEYVAEDFEAIAYRLVVEQVFYHADKHSRLAYWLIDRYERDFRLVLSQIGIDLAVNRRLRYAYAIPSAGKSGIATTAQTLLALVFRKIYDEYARIGQLTDDGEVVCDLVELEEKYKLSTQRELPGKSELDSLLRVLKRWGIVRKVEYDDPLLSAEDQSAQPYAVAIRPAIADLLGETAINQLERWTETGADLEMDEPMEEDKDELQ